MKRNLAFFALLVFMGLAVFAQTRENTSIYVPSTADNPSHRVFFRDSFEAEIEANGYRRASAAAAADYVINLTVRPNNTLKNDGTWAPAAPNEKQFVLQLGLVRGRDSVEIVGFPSLPFTDMTEVALLTSGLFYQISTYIPTSVQGAAPAAPPDTGTRDNAMGDAEVIDLIRGLINDLESRSQDRITIYSGQSYENQPGQTQPPPQTQTVTPEEERARQDALARARQEELEQAREEERARVLRETQEEQARQEALVLAQQAAEEQALREDLEKQAALAQALENARQAERERILREEQKRQAAEEQALREDLEKQAGLAQALENARQAERERILREEQERQAAQEQALREDLEKQAALALALENARQAERERVLREEQERQAAEAKALREAQERQAALALALENARQAAREEALEQARQEWAREEELARQERARQEELARQEQARQEERAREEARVQALEQALREAQAASIREVPIPYEVEVYRDREVPVPYPVEIPVEVYRDREVLVPIEVPVLREAPHLRETPGETPGENREGKNSGVLTVESDAWRNKMLYLRASADFPISYFKIKTQNTNLKSQFIFMPGATLGLEVQFLDHFSTEFDLIARFAADVFKPSFMPGVGLQLKFPFKPAKLMVEPYLGAAFSLINMPPLIKAPRSTTSFYLEAGGGLQVGFKTGPGALFFDVNLMYTLNNDLNRVLPKVVPAINTTAYDTIPAAKWGRIGVGLGIGYKFGFVDRK
jgi:hypothetical protein